MSVSKAEFQRLSGLVRTGAISAITIDTNVVDSNQCSFTGGLVGQLQQFAGAHFHVLLSEVVLREAKAHIARAHTDRLEKLRSVRRHATRYLTNSASLHELSEEIDNLPPPDELAEREADEFIEDTRAEVVRPDSIKIADLLDMYFTAVPPFEKSGNKKSEFPDAIALLSLKSWAEETGRSILMVSNDGDWDRFCKNCDNGRLHYVDDLADALAIINDSADARNQAAQVRLEEAVHQFMDRDGTLFKQVTEDFHNRLLANVTMTATSRLAFDNEVVALDYRDLLVSVSPRPGILRNDVHSLVFYIHLNMYIRVWTRFNFRTLETAQPAGHATRSTGVADEGGVLLTSDESGVKAELIWNGRDLTFDYGDVEPDEISPTSSPDNISPGWMRIEPPPVGV
ncbi:PIN domain-containing protein [Caballeronia sp. LjRoot29]|uniref:PIN domain-containing protein n=1 Tax=Caballeronia sp. LjRoot29 TaxID=3342315 RepID=UPI003ECDF514